MVTISRNAFDLLAPRMSDQIEPASSEAAALAAVQATPITVRAHADIIPLGCRTDYLHVVADGMACRFGVVADGRRQITAVHVAGDICGLEQLEGDAPAGLHALTQTLVLRLPRHELTALARQYASVACVFWRLCAIDAATTAQWLINVGRREALPRIAHFLCEIGVRLEHAGRARRDSFRLPMTQAQLGDLLGLTPVHVNRVLQTLRRSGTLCTDGSAFSIPDWNAMARMADFDPAHLRLDSRARAADVTPRRERAYDMVA